MLKFSGLIPAPLTVPGYSPEARETHINISAGVNSFDSENSDVNFISPY